MSIYLVWFIIIWMLSGAISYVVSLYIENRKGFSITVADILLIPIIGCFGIIVLFCLLQDSGVFDTTVIKGRKSG